MKYILSILLLATQFTLAQTPNRTKSNLKYGVQLSNTGNLFAFPLISTSMCLVLEPNSRHRYVIGISNAWPILNDFDEPLRKLRLAYLYHLTNPENNWMLDFTIDSRNIAWGKTDYWRTSNEETRGIEVHKSNSTHYHGELNVGLGGTRNFQNNLSFSFAMGPTVNICMNRSRYEDPSIDYGFYTCLNYYFFTTVGLTYLVEFKPRIKLTKKIKKKKSECGAF
jgi:hypothetical protein